MRMTIAEICIRRALVKPKYGARVTPAARQWYEDTLVLGQRLCERYPALNLREFLSDCGVETEIELDRMYTCVMGEHAPDWGD